MPFPDTLQSTGRLLEVVVMTKAPVTHNLVTQCEPHPDVRGIQQLSITGQYEVRVSPVLTLTGQ
jgi:hypothetical protein